MTNEMRNVPELRFPEFDGEWEEKKLGDIADFTKGKLLGKKDLIDEGKYPCILYGELYTKYGSIINDVVSRTNVNKDKLKKGSKNQILIPSSGETIEDIATASTLNTNKDVYIGGDLNILTPKEQDGKFISLSLNGINKWNMAKLAQGKTVVHLYNNDIKTLNINLPHKMQEQQKIGEFFSKLDRQIELEEQKLEKLEEQKKGYMQQIFSQELRFKDENGEKFPDWQTTTLGQLSDITTGSLDANAMVPNGKYKFFTCARETYQIDKYAFDTEALLISGNGANVGYIHYYKGKFNAYQRTYVLDNIQNDINFIKYYLERYLIKRIYSEKRDGNTPYITRSTLYDMSISIPLAKLEQMKISRFLTKLDNKIQNQSDKVELLKERKKGLLQKMFI
ncbi:restriction endonuclease subunit S [Staphylococcus simulans]|uniref:restriction endonuclease subunit S n=2 Tax=Staphylococcus simulans TaxID=1286 RepID=UPI000D1E5904|nr:restriction endonuclease subunit S [Staphylococcus simulans]PTJ92198.1 restriction endonuclease subunit S [Staphylococcus simulans]